MTEVEELRERIAELESALRSSIYVLPSEATRLSHYLKVAPQAARILLALYRAPGYILHSEDLRTILCEREDQFIHLHHVPTVLSKMNKKKSTRWVKGRNGPNSIFELTLNGQVAMAYAMQCMAHASGSPAIPKPAD